MPDPMTPKRYRDPALRERLAGEYVLGTLSPRVQARMTRLMACDPDWWQWIAQWQQHLDPLLPSPSAPIQPVRYLAMMSSAGEEAPFVLVAYQGKQPGQSSIRLQQNQASPLHLPADAMLWMRDKASAKLVPLAPLKEVMAGRLMSPTEWQQLKASSELLVMAKDSEHPLYRGHCIELGPWPTES